MRGNDDCFWKRARTGKAASMEREFCGILYREVCFSDSVVFPLGLCRDSKQVSAIPLFSILGEDENG